MWRNEVTDRSWNILQRLRLEFPFALIGGWAVYLYTHALKSKDIDIVVGLDVLDSVKTKYDVRKNNRLRMYEFVVDDVDVGTYVPFYSDLGVPAEVLLENSQSLEGFRIPKAEYLLATKQKAKAERRGSDKGLKDRIDILSLLLTSELDLYRYAEVLSNHHLSGYLEELRKMVVGADREMRELGIDDPGKVRRLKKELLSKIDEARAADLLNDLAEERRLDEARTKRKHGAR